MVLPALPVCTVHQLESQRKRYSKVIVMLKMQLVKKCIEIDFIFTDNCLDGVFWVLESNPVRFNALPEIWFKMSALLIAWQPSLSVKGT